MKTAEFVSPGHPDKICDRIADNLLDKFLMGDPDSRVAIEVMGGHGQVNISGEVTSKTEVDVEAAVKEITDDQLEISSNIVQQSSFIAQGVDGGGAGDQGIMVGYASLETPEFLPKEYVAARSLCRRLYQRFPYDGKVQVTVDEKNINTVVASFQNVTQQELLATTKQFLEADKYLINPAGDWTSGGFTADSGLSGRKIIVDNYGPQVPVGGGSFSGKDYTKVDRSGAYMARWIAIDLIKKGLGQEIMVKLAYAIGEPQPVMANAHIDGKILELRNNYDLRPAAIREHLNLRQFKFLETASWGHFGNQFPWDHS